MESKTKRSFKFALVGEAGCGKTSISLKYISFTRYMTNIFHDPYPPTVGAMFYQKELIYKNEPISIEIWDTAGEERFAKLASFYYKYKRSLRNSEGIVIVYDIASKDSFERAEKWIAEVKEKAEPNVALILVGNKCDLPPESRVIKKEDAALYATNAGLKFIESSAKTGDNIDNIFYQLLESIPSINNPHLGVHLTQKPQNQKKHCCGGN